MLVLVLFCFLFSTLCLSSFAIILIGKRGLGALLRFSSWSFVAAIVPWLFRAVPWVGLQCVIVVYPGCCFFIDRNTS